MPDWVPWGADLSGRLNTPTSFNAISCGAPVGAPVRPRQTAGN